MMRTNMYFPNETIQKLRSIARKEDTSVTELVRTFVEEGLQEKMKTGISSLSLMAKNAKASGRGDLAKNHDYYLYGKGRI